MRSSATQDLTEQCLELLKQIKVLLIVPEDAPFDTMTEKIAESQQAEFHVPVEILTESQIQAAIEQEYADIGLEDNSN